MGYAYIERDRDTYRYIESGVMGVTRDENETFKDYRFRLIHFWQANFFGLLCRCNIQKVVSEILPARGGGNFIGGATQSDLAKAAVTVCQVEAIRRDMDWDEIAAISIKKRMTGSGKATKTKVANAVFEMFPHLLDERPKREWKADETDAIAIAVVGLGYQMINAKTQDSPRGASALSDV